MLRRIRLPTLLVLAIVGTSVSSTQPGEPGLHQQMMTCTFFISGEGSSGTAFLIWEAQETSGSLPLLATAAHVLDHMKGEFAQISLRKKQQDAWSRHNHRFRIRNGNHPCWTSHDKFDVAIIPLQLPPGTHNVVVPLDMLATSDSFGAMDLQPGDSLTTLGYPYGAMSHSAGFPILRRGPIASFPLPPARSVYSMILDLEVFPGNSGGPVLFTGSEPRARGGSSVISGSSYVVGLMTKSRYRPEMIGSAEFRRDLGLAIVLPSDQILATIQKVPEKLDSRCF